MVVSIILVFLVLLLAFGVIVGLVVLLANSKTRLVGVLLALVGGLLLASGLLYVRLASLRGQAIVTPQNHGPTIRVYPSPEDSRFAGPAKPASDRVIVELSTGPDGASAEKKVGSVLRILASAVLKALDEQEQSDPLPERVEAPLASTVADEPLSTPRPAWVDQEPQLVKGVYQMTISIGPYLTLDECQSKLPEELQKAVGEYVGRHLGAKASQRVRLPLDYIEEHLVQARLEERKQFSVGPMMRLHVLLGFDRMASERIREEWRRLVVQDRISILGFLGSVLFLFLTTIYVYLKADLATEGRYRGRLRLAAGTAVVLLIVLIVAVIA